MTIYVILLNILTEMRRLKAIHRRGRVKIKYHQTVIFDRIIYSKAIMDLIKYNFTVLRKFFVCLVPKQSMCLV